MVSRDEARANILKKQASSEVEKKTQDPRPGKLNAVPFDSALNLE